MRFSILHISDVHRDLTDEVDNASLVDSLARDFARYREQPEILVPSLCIATGDLVYGVNPSTSDASSELKRQYDQARDFLVTVSDRLFGGNRERVVILPGNHDVSLADVIASVERIQIPDTAAEKSQLVDELFKPHSRLRWSWQDLCFYRITDQDRYMKRFRHFADCYSQFYEGHRAFSLNPDEQFDVFDFPG